MMSDLLKDFPLFEQEWYKFKPSIFQQQVIDTQHNLLFLLNKLKDYSSKSDIYQILDNISEIKNPWLAFEYLLIEYLDEKNIFKADEEKWEWNGIDLFIKKNWVQVTVSDKLWKKRKIEKVREKINKWETFKFPKKDWEENVWETPILNTEVPKNVILFKIEDPIIKYLVSQDKWRLSYNFQKLNTNSKDKFVESLDIIKKSLKIVLEKIYFIEKNSDINLQTIPNTEKSINFDKTKNNKYEEKLDNWMENNYKWQQPYFQNVLSNITHFYDKKNNTIVFKVYSNIKQKEIIYSFTYYISNKKIVNNKFENKQFVWKANQKTEIEKEAETENHNKEREITNILKYNKKYNQTLNDIKNSIRKKYNLDIKSIKNKLIKKLVYNISQNPNFIKLKKYFVELNTTNKEEIQRYSENLKQTNQEKIEIKKQITWLNNFLKDISGIIKWKNINIEEIWIWTITDQELLLNDIIIKKYWLLQKWSKLNNNIQKIKSILEEINIKWLDSSKIIIRLQKILFIKATTYKSWNNYTNNIIKKINNTKLELEEEMKALIIKSIWIKSYTNSKIKTLKWWNKIDINLLFSKRLKNKYLQPYTELEKKHKLITLLNNLLQETKTELWFLRNFINKIDFNDLLISQLNGDNLIYSNKFLSDTMIWIIFKWEKNIRALWHKKIIEKLNEFKIPNFNPENFIALLEMYISFKNTIQDNDITQVNGVINKQIILLKDKLNQLTKKVNSKTDIETINIKKFKQKEHEIILLLEKYIWKKNIILNKNSIDKFVYESILSNKNIEKLLEELFSNIWIDYIEKIKEDVTLLDKYEWQKENIEKLNHISKKIYKDESSEEISQDKKEIIQKIESLQTMFEEIKNIYNLVKI